MNGHAVRNAIEAAVTTESDVAIGSPSAALTSAATMQTTAAIRDGRAGQGRRSHRWLGELAWNSSALASADATVKALFMDLAKRPADVCYSNENDYHTEVAFAVDRFFVSFG
ncbi:hypothetical protein [Caballeronia sp. LZ024]|uniref:hypothetical protein n=1 Tax=Caballeronia sp. LZ024 TaxID=3038561 RepID=UPI002854AFF4|nr:hypothetical protein [Caballeronia sp. LZ024]MDR5753108.1 hypothetical protein [Caballeronia sp. LZ024]